jgi:hypothetical protein
MPPKTNTRVTVDIPTIDHKKLKMLAAYHGKSMREIFVELIEHGLEHYQECSESHIPNETTQQALKNVLTKKGLQKTDSVEALFKKLSE